MRLSTPLAASSVPFLFSGIASAGTFDIVGRPRASLDRLLTKRSVDIGAFGNGSQIVDNGEDTIYSCNITLGGAEFEVLIDTGSSDLWVHGDVPGTKDLNIDASVNYAAGSAKGSINTAELGFDDFTVKDQAYIKADQVEGNEGIQGVIGLGPSSASTVSSLTKKANVNGAPPLDRIFQQNTSTPNFLTVLLSRDSDDAPGGTAPQTGQLTVGSIIPGREDISKQPKLPGLTDQFGIQHWQTLLDENGIIGPDGNNITTKTSIQKPAQGTANQFHVIFDTGFTFPQMTQDVADAIYGRVPGAKFVAQDSSPGFWRIPCDYELNISFVFNNVKIPIHPLDLSMPEDGKSGKNCMSTFQQISPQTANHKSFGAFDLILGMAFLRNTYLLIDFGDFVDGSKSNVGDPYIQLLPITDPAKAHEDFVTTRLGGVDTTSSQQALVPESEAQHSPDVNDPNAKQAFNDDVDDDSNKPWYKTWKLFLVIGAGCGLIVIAVLAFVIRWCRTRRSYVRKEAGFVPQMAGVGAYSKLGEPLGPGHMRSYSHEPWQTQGHYEEPHYQYGGRGAY